jgi:hypothetical protein
LRSPSVPASGPGGGAGGRTPPRAAFSCPGGGTTVRSASGNKGLRGWRRPAGQAGAGPAGAGPAVPCHAWAVSRKTIPGAVGTAGALTAVNRAGIAPRSRTSTRSSGGFTGTTSRVRRSGTPRSPARRRRPAGCARWPRPAVYPSVEAAANSVKRPAVVTAAPQRLRTAMVTRSVSRRPACRTAHHSPVRRLG